MADKHPLHQRHHASAKQSEEAIARLQNNDSYKLAFADNDFLLEDDLRHVRLQLEYLKPERVLDKHQIDATVVVFGSARFLSPEQAQYNLDIAQAELYIQRRKTVIKKMTRVKAQKMNGMTRNPGEVLETRAHDLGEVLETCRA